MLPFQVGAIDPNRPTNKGITSWKRVSSGLACCRSPCRPKAGEPPLRVSGITGLLIIDFALSFHIGVSRVRPVKRSQEESGSDAECVAG